MVLEILVQLTQLLLSPHHAPGFELGTGVTRSPRPLPGWAKATQMSKWVVSALYDQCNDRGVSGVPPQGVPLTQQRGGRRNLAEEGDSELSVT